MKSFALFILTAGLALSSKDAVAGSCQGDSAEARFLPRMVGRPYASIRTPYFMPCDTMEVRIGDTSTIHPGVMMHFGPAASSENVILVRGRLEVMGSQEAPVAFSGSLLDGDFGPKPGSGSWGGFRVDPVGEIIFQHVRIFRATPAMESRSERVKLSKVVLKQCMDFNGPNGQSLALDFTETKIDDLDFSAPAIVETKEQENEPQQAQATVSPSSNAPLTWSLIVAGALLAGGGLFWYLAEKQDGNPKPPAGETLYPDRPVFPPGIDR